MDKKDIRIPQQKRSIEKKEKILEAAMRIFMEKGYFGINTADIAKEAGISTGSVYAYFEDKKDILLECLNRFGNSLTRQICDSIGNLPETGNITNTVKDVLYIFVGHHSWTNILHDEIMSMKFRDDDVKNYFEKTQSTMMSAVTTQLGALGYAFKHEREQTFLLFQLIMGIEDELAFNQHSDINKELLIDECAQTIVSMLIKTD